MGSPIYLSRLVLNIRSREARRDLANCVAMHRTLMNAFPDGLSSNGAARSEAGLLYRVEATSAGAIALLVQSVLPPVWARLPSSWLEPASEPQVKEITEALGRIDSGSVLRFKLVANPTRKIGTKTGADGRKNNGKRVELRGEEEWLAWLERMSCLCRLGPPCTLPPAHLAHSRASWIPSLFLCICCWTAWASCLVTASSMRMTLCL